jgi:hypothetical protein
MSIMASGGTHDSLAFALTDMAKLLSQGKLPAPYFFAGDEAYVANDSLATPWSGKKLSSGSI